MYKIGSMVSTDSSKEKIAVFPGSFDPFTIGHYSIVNRGLQLFDKIIIAIGNNEQKKSSFSVDRRLSQLESLYRQEKKVEILVYDTLTTDFAKKVGAQFILRGIRSVQDFEYEKNIADINRSLTGIETLFLLAEPEYAHISSSVVRELLHYGKDISQFLPDGMQI